MTARVNTVKRVPKNEINFKIKLNEEQKEAKRIIYDSKIVAVTGKAGSGKTLIGCEVALSMFFKRQINRIVITRPTVRLRGTEDLGMLPGEISEKLLPYTDPIVDNMNKLIGKEKIDIMLKKGEIIVKPLQFIRGITIDNEILLIDECLYKDVQLTVKENGVEKHMCMDKIAHSFLKQNDIEALSYNHEKDIVEYKSILNVQIARSNKWISVIGSFRNGEIKCTENHPFLIFNENGEFVYTPANNLKIGDTLIKSTNFSYKNRNNFIVNENLDILLGFLLGDGSLSKNKSIQSAYRISKNHGLSQKDYMLFCMSLFKNARESTPKSGFTGETICGFTSKSYVIPNNFIKSLYNDGKKTPSKDIKNYFTKRTLALWLMDDGSFEPTSGYLSLHSQGFNRKSNEILKEILKEKFDIDVNIRSVKKQITENSKPFYYYLIQMDRKNSNKYFELVKGLIHPNLKYKINKELYKEFDYSLYETFKNVYSLHGITIQDLETSNEEALTFNVEVKDNNNYFANNILTHNCQNVENQQLKAILTRIGKESKMIFTGDINQCDLNSEFNSGLLKLKKLSEQLTEINFVELKENHRDPIVEKILELW